LSELKGLFSLHFFPFDKINYNNYYCLILFCPIFWEADIFLLVWKIAILYGVLQIKKDNVSAWDLQSTKIISIFV